MKKNLILMLAAVAAAFTAVAQSSKWFVSAATGYPMGGPAASIKNNMKQSGLDQTSTYNILFGLFSGSVSYPIIAKNPPLLIKAGKRLTNKRSLYLVAGLSGTGAVEGFRNVGYEGGMDPVFGGSYGVHVDVKYKLFQVAAGYQYSFSNTHAKLAIAPSAFLFSYQNTRAGQSYCHMTVAPGASLSGRLPLGKEKRLFGVDLVAELNLATPVTMKTLTTVETYDGKTIEATLQSGTVNLMHGMLGLAFSFRR